MSVGQEVPQGVVGVSQGCGWWWTRLTGNSKARVNCRNAVHHFWRKELQLNAETLESLCYMKTGFMSLDKTHLIYSQCTNRRIDENVTIM